ncbi:MAG: glycosyltransferase family 39 protein [Victivallales bacterium]|jgi:4-amino-4-deoxy-L-arabinose transferase-like glycosyltransferase|nr:glycosyltransferase family 39 protein [Victivallales bacterium]
MRLSQLTNYIEFAFERIAKTLNAASPYRLLLVLCTFFTVWRAVTLNFMEKSGDAVWKWGFLRYYAMTDQWYPLYPDHHQGRWGINMPTLGFIELLGDSPFVYYIYPLLMALGTGIMLFLIVRRLCSQVAATMAFLLCMLFPLTVRESTQFLPMLPAAFYVLCATYLVMRHIASGRILPVFFAGILIGIAYGCKFTSLYWGAAFLLFFSLFPSGKKTRFKIWKFHFGAEIFIMALGIFLVIVVETLLLNRLFGTSLGRIEVIMGSHLKSRPNPQYLNFFQYLFSFLRPLDFRGKYFETVPLIMLFVASLPLAIFQFRKGNKEQRFITLSFLTVYLLHCYMVYKIFPFLHPERPHGRYFLILAVFAIIILSVSWRAGCDELKRRFSKSLVVIAEALFAGMLLLLMLIRAINQFGHGEHLFALLDSERKFAVAKSENLPVLSKIRDREKFLNNQISSRDFKYGDMWVTFRGPVELIPQYEKRFFPFKDEQGRLWILLFPQSSIILDKPIRCLLLDEFESEITEKRFSALPKELQIQQTPLVE